MRPNVQTPIPLRNAINLDRICNDNPCDFIYILGSFWPNFTQSFESHIVKSFKECNPAHKFEPHISALCEFYADLISGSLRGRKIDWIVRVLGSAEKELDLARPQSLLADVLSANTGAKNMTSLFFKSESRPSMRSVKHLSGPDAMRNRIRYVAQDLFIRSSKLSGTVLLIDDIYNTGASMRVYSYALKEYAGADTVYGVNLAATRFKRGKDGHRLLKLDTSGIENKPSLCKVWLDAENIFHLDDNCPAIQPKITPVMRFIVEQTAKPCQACCHLSKPTRKWWHFGKRGGL